MSTKHKAPVHTAPDKPKASKVKAVRTGLTLRWQERMTKSSTIDKVQHRRDSHK